MLSEEELAEQRKSDAEKAAAIVRENKDLINRFDTLAGKVIKDLEETTEDFNSLLSIRGEIDKMPKKNNLIVSAALGFDVIGNISTTRAMIEGARKTLIERGK